MVDDKDSEDVIRPSNEDIYTPPEEQYGDQQSPAVATSQGKNFVVMGIFILILALLVFLFLGGGEDDDPIDGRTTSVQPAPRGFIPPPAFDIPPPTPPTPPEPKKDDKEDKETDVKLAIGEDPQQKARLQSNMLITSGVFGSTNLSSGFGGSDGPKDVYGPANNSDPNVGFADSFFNQDGVPHAYARKLANTNRLITQGKIIETVLETPINTDIPGMIRAVVSRDVYAESGRAILIPKGSRVVGTYNNFVIRGNKRVNVIWSRVIRPDGFDIMIRSSGTDQLGRAGIDGEVDNKYAEIFSTAFLVSAINIAIGVAVDAIEDDEVTQTTNTDGSTTRNSTATHEAAVEAVDLFGNTAENLVQGFLNLKPTITINQGTRVSIFVNRDLLFPDEFVSDLQIIQ